MDKNKIKELALQRIIEKANKKFVFSVIKNVTIWVLMLAGMFFICHRICASTPNIDYVYYGGPRLLIGWIIPIIYGMVTACSTFLDLKAEYYKRGEWIQKKHKEIRFSYMVNGGL